jgi:hypothetical protein
MSQETTKIAPVQTMAPEGSTALQACVFCQEPTCHPSDDYCFGCRCYVCAACDTHGFEMPLGGHEVWAHQGSAA